MIRAKAISGVEPKISRTHRGPRAQHVFKVGRETQEIQVVLNRMSKENLRSPDERSFHIHYMEVRPIHSSREVGQCPWSEGNSKMWIEFNILAPFSEKNKARQR